MKKKVIIIGALPSSLVNFRGDLIRDIGNAGYQVIGMANNASDEDVTKVESLDARYISFPIERNGLNPVNDLKTLISLIRVFRKEKPDVVLSYTIKPVVWGGIAARLAGVKRFYALITGLGFAFQKGGLKRNILSKVAVGLYRLALSRAKGVIFQNPDNLNTFVELSIVPKSNTHRVFGSGVNLDSFQKTSLPVGAPTFLCIARLLGEKGLREYAEAARAVKKKYPEAVFQLLGPEDPSPDGIPIEEVKAWNNQGYIEYLGEAANVIPYIEKSHIYVLPSYHEGMPRTVLEAMSIGRPILTTDVSGCRETVEHGQNGFLVEKENVQQLIDRMSWFIENTEVWVDMADASYQLVCEKFDVRKVNQDLIRIMQLDCKQD